MNEAAEKLAAPAESLEEKVIARLRTVFDPEIPVNIYDLGLIYKIAFTPALENRFDLTVDMTLTTPNCPVAQSMPGMAKQAVEKLEELHEVTVNLVWEPPWTKEKMSEETRLQLNMM